MTYSFLRVLFCIAIKIHSISLLRFPHLSHVQVFLCIISLVCCLKYPYSCFSSHFSILDFFYSYSVLNSLWQLVSSVSFPGFWHCSIDTMMIDATVSFIFHIFSVLRQGLSIYLVFHFSLISPRDLSKMYQAPQLLKSVFPWS